MTHIYTISYDYCDEYKYCDPANSSNHTEETYVFLDEETRRRFIESKTEFGGMPCTVKKISDSDYRLLVERDDELFDVEDWEVYFDEKTIYEGEKE
jgi:hypothetical protein